MARFDASSARCEILTFKEGMLSSMAHDLKIAVTRFVIEVDEAARSIDATFDARSLRVVCAMRAGVETASLGPDDQRQIEQNIVEEVLHSRRHPEIRFRSTSVAEEGGALRVDGMLSLHGREGQVAVVAKDEHGQKVAEVSLHQPDFGIRPFRAMLGALRIRPDVIVRVSLPWPPPRDAGPKP